MPIQDGQNIRCIVIKRKMIQSKAFGCRSRVEAIIWSDVISWPAYADLRAIMQVMVLSATGNAVISVGSRRYSLTISTSL